MYTKCTHPFNGPFFPGVPRWASTSEWQWHQLSHICKSAPRSTQTATPSPQQCVFYTLDALPAAQPTASKHIHKHTHTYIYIYCHTGYTETCMEAVSICHLENHEIAVWATVWLTHTGYVSMSTNFIWRRSNCKTRYISVKLANCCITMYKELVQQVQSEAK